MSQNRHQIPQNIISSIPTCASCCRLFTAIYNKNFKHLNRRPILLPCSHSLCERCWYSQTNNYIKCKQCNRLAPIDKTRNTNEQFQYNFFVVGLVNYLKQISYFKNIGIANNSSVIDALPLSSVAVNEKTDKICCECNSVSTDHYCVDCHLPYCPNCFKKVHKLGKAFQQHCLIDSLENQIFEHKPDYCSEHPNDKITYFCQMCNSAICNNCKQGQHSLHLPVCLYDVNINLQSVINEIIPQLIQADNKNQKTIKNCDGLYQQQEKYARQTIDSISGHFIYFHGILQNLEKELVGKINHQLSNARHNLKEVQQKFKSLSDDIKINLCNLEYYNKNIPYDINLSEVISESKKLCQKSNYHCEDLPENPFRFKVIEFSKIQLEKHFVLECKDIRKTDLISAIDNNQTDHTHEDSSKEINCDLPLLSSVDKQIDDIPNLLGENMVRVEKKTLKTDVFEPSQMAKEISSIKEKYKKNDDTPSHSQSLPSSFNRCSLKKRKSSHSLNTQQVQMAYIKNPSNFYVHNLLFKSVQDQFFEICEKDALLFHRPPNRIIVGHIYLVNISKIESSKWYRGKVLTKTANNEDREAYQVFFVDYGSTKLVEKQALREMSKDLALRPYGAIYCSLFNLKPKSLLWTDEASWLMTEITANQLVSMVTLIESEPLLVDLILLHRSTPVSVRDALIARNLAENIITDDPNVERKLEELAQLKKSLITTPELKYHEQNFKLGEIFAAQLVHVVSPSEFYIIKKDHAYSYNKLKLEMNTFYQDNYKNKIYEAHINMAVAVFDGENWYRGSILKVFPDGQLEIYFVDVGFKQIVNQTMIRKLENEFIGITNGAVRCQLWHIEALEENNYEWTEAAISDFQLIAQRYSFEIFIGAIHDDNTYSIILYIVLKDKNICVNASLVSTKHAVSTGNESLRLEYPKDDDDTKEYSMNAVKEDVDKVSFRSEVKITHYVSPSEFYCTFQKHCKGIHKMEQEIQKRIQHRIAEKRLINYDNFKWSINDNCLVNASIDVTGLPKWRRGVIKIIDKIRKNLNNHYDEIFSVFLRDYGTVAKVKLENLEIIDDVFLRVRNGAIKCHLGHVKPTADMKTWSSSAVEILQKCINRFNRYAITALRKSVDGSIPVILWSVEEEDDPLKPSYIKNKNLNEILICKGLAEQLEKFPEKFDYDNIEQEILKGSEDFDQWLVKMDKNKEDENKSESGSMSVAYDLSDDICYINKWLPSEGIDETLFCGIPTYVDNNGVIYLHDVKQVPLLHQMKEVINNKFANSLQKPTDIFWRIGEPCMVRYHLDKQFYRGVIRKVQKNSKTWLVHFVDYGNIEECEAKDLRKDVILGNIPIQASRYRLAHISSVNDDKTWKCECLDIMHSMIIPLKCIIRVESNQEHEEIKACSIRHGDLDLADVLVAKKYAVRNKNVPHRDIISNLVMMEPEKKNEIKASSVEYFQSNTINELIKEIDQNIQEDDNDDIIMDYNYGDDDDFIYDDIELHPVDNKIVDADPKKEVNQNDDMSSELTFDPMTGHTSSKINDNMFSSIHLPVLKLSDSLKGFLGEVVHISAPNDLHIFPLIPEHIQNHENLMMGIQKVVKVNVKKIPDINLDRPCLAIYEPDNLWYRALIRSHDLEANEIDVWYVDHLHYERIKANNIRKMPSSFYNFPLRTIRVKLSNVKLNPRYREDDIRRELVKYVVNRKIYVKIIKNQSVPIVELYEDEYCKKQIYESMIRDRYFLPK